MKIRAVSAFNCGGPIKAGEEKDFPDELAKSLVKEGLAVEVVEEKKKPGDK